MRKFSKKKLLRFCQILAILIVFFVTMLFWKEFRGLSVEEILSLSPEKMLLSVGLILIYYILKSFIVIIPVLVVQIAAGLLFPIPLAIAVNLIGLILTLSISYWLGCFLGHDIVEKLVRRYPKSAVIQTFPQQNEFLFCFLIHSLCVFPMNMIGMFIGSLGIHYRKYFWGAFLGSLIRVVSVTVMGTAATKPTSPAFLISLGITVLVSVASFFAYKRQQKKMSAENTPTNIS